MEKMKRTSNNKLNYPGHIDCRNSSSNVDKLEWESKLSVKLRAALRIGRLAAPSPVLRSNLNSNSVVKKIDD